MWKQPKCPSTDEWIKMWCSLYNGILPNHKRNDIGSFVVTWRDLESVLQSEVSYKEKNKHHILMHIYGLEKDGTDEPIHRAAMEMQTWKTD